jgi:hypothetical protein
MSRANERADERFALFAPWQSKTSLKAVDCYTDCRQSFWQMDKNLRLNA